MARQTEISKDYELFLEQLMYCDRNVVTMGGDKFLLTVPTRQAMADLATMHTDDKLTGNEIPSDQEISFGITGKTISILSTGDWDLRRDDVMFPKGVASYRDGQLKYSYDSGNTPVFNFRLCLIPLTRDEKPDLSFWGSMAPGEPIKGGAVLNRNGIDPTGGKYGKVERWRLGISDAPLSITEETDSPLTWYYCGGALIGAEPIGRATIQGLIQAKLIPIFNKELPASLSGPDTSEQLPDPRQPRITMTPTGDKELDDFLQFYLSMRDPLEQTFPVGSMVNIAVPEYELANFLENKADIYGDEATYMAKAMCANPCPIISALHLQDETGTMRPCVTVRSPNGCTVALWADMVQFA